MDVPPKDDAEELKAAPPKGRGRPPGTRKHQTEEQRLEAIRESKRKWRQAKTQQLKVYNHDYYLRKKEGA
jgi:SRSO17 transposase